MDMWTSGARAWTVAAKLLGRLVPLGGEDGLQDEAAGRGHPPPVLSDESQDALDTGGQALFPFGRASEGAHALHRSPFETPNLDLEALASSSHLS